MDEKPRRRIRNGLIVIFALIVSSVGLMTFWNPFDRPSRDKLHLIEPGMTAAEVMAMVGTPDSTTKDKTHFAHGFSNAGESWVIVYANEKVAVIRHLKCDPESPPP